MKKRIKNNKNLYAFLSYDYGGGYNLFEFFKKRLFKNNFSFFFQGPSAKMLVKSSFKNNKKLKNLKKFKEVFYSLSWDKTLEKFIYNQKKIYNFKTCLILDGWGNYKDKMKIYNKVIFVPDHIVCLDKFSYKLIIQQFPMIKKNIVCLNNFLFDELINRFKKIYTKNTKEVLYLASPMIKQSSIKKIILFLKKFNKTDHIKIRYHPKKIYKPSKSFLDDISTASAVFGHYSTLLIYAKILGINSYSINHSNHDYFDWKKFSIFKNFKVKELYDKSFNSCFKKKNFK